MNHDRWLPFDAALLVATVPSLILGACRFQGDDL
jgi:hypothetical protein